MKNYITIEEYNTLPEVKPVKDGKTAKVKIEGTANSMYPFAVQCYFASIDPNYAISGQYLEMCKTRKEYEVWINQHKVNQGSSGKQ